jgi:hypothetical protein
MQTKVLAIVMSRLAELGWADTGNTYMKVASKAFETAVGQKTALIFCRERGSRTYLSADYQSEGRNALLCCWCELVNDAPEAAIAAAVSRFVEGAEKQVAQTYAMRLYDMGLRYRPHSVMHGLINPTYA